MKRGEPSRQQKAQEFQTRQENRRACKEHPLIKAGGWYRQVGDIKLEKWVGPALWSPLNTSQITESTVWGRSSEHLWAQEHNERSTFCTVAWLWDRVEVRKPSDHCLSSGSRWWGNEPTWWEWDRWEGGNTRPWLTSQTRAELRTANRGGERDPVPVLLGLRFHQAGEARKEKLRRMQKWLSGQEALTPTVLVTWAEQ